LSSWPADDGDFATGAPSTGRVASTSGPHKVLRSFGKVRTKVRVGGVEIGGEGFAVIAGPCAVEGVEQVEVCAAVVHQGGAHLLRGGVFTSIDFPNAVATLTSPMRQTPSARTQERPPELRMAERCWL